MTVPARAKHISAAEAARFGIIEIIKDAALEDIVVTQQDEPAVVIMRADRIRRLEDKLEDVRDLTLAATRTLTERNNLVPFDEALAVCGLTEADLDRADDLT